MNELMPLVPEIVLICLTMAIFLSGLIIRKKETIALLCIASATVTAYMIPGYAGTAFGGMFISDGYSVFFKMIFMVNIFLTVLLSRDYAPIKRESYGEYYSLILLASTGMMLMASAGDLIVLYLGLELMSLSTYVLTGFLRHDVRSNEAALKYFLLGTFATALLLYGITMIYGLTGTTNIKAVADFVMENGLATNPVLTVSVILLSVAFSFKIAAAPFHMWAPDAYEGAPTSVTAFMSVGPKAAAFAAFGRFFYEALGAARVEWAVILIAIAILTIVVGNVLALAQQNIKRMLAYSSIAHAGYILLGIIPGTEEGLKAVMLYLLIYAFMNMGAFAVVILLERKATETRRCGDTEISYYKGLAKSHPFIAAAMLVFMFSLTGIPPTAGFIGKFNLFMEAVRAGYTLPVIIAVVFSVMSAFYYLRIVVNMYMKEMKEEAAVTPSLSLNLAILITVLTIFIIGIMPGIVIW